MPRRRSKKPTPAQAALWEKRFRQLAAFRRRHGHCRVPVHYAPDRSFGNWVSQQRQSALRGRLLASRRRRLLALGVELMPLVVQWNKMAAGLAAFKRHHGHTLVPRQWNKPRGLGCWVACQRHLHNTGRLKAGRVRQLTRLGFDFAPEDPRWDAQFARLVKFQKKHGHCNVPSGDDFGQWVYMQRKRRRQGELDPGKIQRLDAISFEWVKPGQVGTFNAARWRHRVQELKAFKRKHGHCQVSQSQRNRHGLGVWVGNLRADYRKGQLPSDRIRELDALGFAWQSENLCWEGHFAELTAFKQRHGHCRVPQVYAANPALGAFVANARASRRAGTLSPDQIRQLDDLEFVWEPMASTWERRFAELVLFHQQHGHWRVPQHGTQRTLASFVARLRKQKRLGRLSAERRATLDALGFVWQPVWGGSKPRGGGVSAGRLIPQGLPVSLTP